MARHTKVRFDGRVLKKSAEKQVIAFVRDTLSPVQVPSDANAWTKQAATLRRRVLDEVYLKGFTDEHLAGGPTVVWGPTLRVKGAPYRIRKLRYQAIPGYWVPGLLYEPLKLKGKVPVVLNPNGHHRGGKAATYKQIRCANLARRGMIALNFEFIGMGELEADALHNQAAHLSLTGMCGAGLFHMAMKRGLDVLLDHKHADPARVAMTGLSGGGWQTIILSALDPRITVSVPVAGYTTIRARADCVADIGDYEQCPPDLAATADYDALTAMLAPRASLVIMNAKDDCCFRTERARPVIFDPVKSAWKLFDASERFAYHSNEVPGTHNYDEDNRTQLYRWLNRWFGLDTPDVDLHTDDEVWLESDLNVGLPLEHRNMMELAAGRAADLVASHRTPRTAGQRRALRRRLTEVIRLPAFDNTTHTLEAKGGRLRGLVTLGPWQTPVVGRTGEGVPRLAVSRYGRMGVRYRLDQHTGPYFAADLLGFGEAGVDTRFLMVAESAGARILGIHVAQIMAVAGSLPGSSADRPIELEAHGSSAALAALLAAALHPGRFSRVALFDDLASMRLLTAWALTYAEQPSLFCRDLLTVADVPQIEALLEGIELERPSRKSRARVFPPG